MDDDYGSISQKDTFLLRTGPHTAHIAICYKKIQLKLLFSFFLQFSI